MSISEVPHSHGKLEQKKNHEMVLKEKSMWNMDLKFVQEIKVGKKWDDKDRNQGWGWHVVKTQNVDNT